jgi:TolA-binding protein
MNQGLHMKRSIIATLLICGVYLQGGQSGNVAYAGSLARAIESNTGKAAAPTKEDSADYFSSKRGDVDADTARQADQLRVKTMASIKTLLEDKKNSRQEFELTLRLGELHVERADYLRDLEIAEYVNAHKKWEETDPKTRPKNPPAATYKRSEASLYNAAQVFRRLTSKFPTHPRTDAALYSLARTLGRLDDDAAVQYYKQLISNHSRSQLVPDAWLALGEFYFDKHKIKEATDAYQQVITFKTHRAYPYAVYKLGWCFYNSQGVSERSPGENLRKSIVAFQLVVKLSDKRKAGNFNLREEALRDLVMSYAEAEDTEGAWRYFKEIGEDQRFYTMLERMGGLYADAGKSAKATEVYTRLVSESPNRANNPQIHQKMLELYDNLQKFPDVVKTLSIMQNLYVDQSRWTTAQGDNKKVIDDARTLTERSMHRYGTMFHSRGQKIKMPALENYASEIYNMYLTSFGKLEAAYDIRFYLADIQMAQKKFPQASSNFVMVARQKPKDGSHLKEAAFNAVDAIASLHGETKFAPVPPPGQAPAPLEIPRVKKLYADTIDFYVSILPNEKPGLPMRYTAAQIYFDYGNYPEAVKRFDELAFNYGPSKQGQSAARTVIAYYNEKADWSNVVTYGKKYQASKDIAQDGNIKKFIDDSLRAGLFNSAMASEKNNDFAKAAAAFLEFQKMFPMDQNADRALYNASLNQFKAGQVTESIATQKSLLNTYPKSVLAPDVMAGMAETYEAIAQFQEAAETYKQFASYYPNDKRAPVSLFNAGVLYRGIKRTNLAASAFGELYRKYPNHPAANDAIFESARIKELAGDPNGAIADFSLFANNPANKGKNEALYAQAKTIALRLAADPKNDSAHRDLAKMSGALRVKNSPAAPAARQVVAKLLFDDQESGVKAFLGTTLNNPREIERQAANKQSRLVRLANAYQDIIALSNAEYTVASYYRLGELHEDFAKSLFNASAPEGLNAKESSEFKSQLDKAAFPLKEEAYKFFETAYRQSSEVETFTPWTQKTFKKMVQLAPEKHPAVDEQSADPGYMSYKVSLNKATEVLAD